MYKIKSKYARVMAIAPSTRGFGFAVLEGQHTLINWGRKQVKGDKNKGTLLLVEKLIIHYTPQIIVLEDASAKNSRRAPRIRKLTKQIKSFASKRRIRVALFSRKQISRTFFPGGLATKHQIAEMIANRFQDELGFRLPPKRRAWETEDPKMDIFAALALILSLCRRC